MAGKRTDVLVGIQSEDALSTGISIIVGTRESADGLGFVILADGGGGDHDGVRKTFSDTPLKECVNG